MTRLKPVTKPYLAILFIISLLPAYTFAAEPWLIATQSEAINFGQKLTFIIVKPEAASTAWPDSLRMKLSGSGNTEEIELKPAKATESNLMRRSYVGVASKKYLGVVRAELAGQPSNRLVMLAPNEDSGSTQLVDASGEANKNISSNSTSQEKMTGNATSTNNNGPVVVLAKPGDEPALSANEPTYFVVGNNNERGNDARFQISFKYRPFDPEGSVAQFAPFLSNVYFAYTQTTLWDLGENSSPFRDTSYRPSMFYRWVGKGRGLFPDEWRVGAEHESNGQAGLDSRSINTSYIRPTWNFDFDNGKRLSFFPKFHQYLDKDENSDIQRYRGYTDWQLRYGREDGLVLGGLYRLGTGGYSTAQLDLSYPVSDRIFARTGTFLHLQLFSGYGETLLDYNRDSDTQVRIGLSIAR